MAPRHVDVLLIGGGVAAARCARTLRRRGFTGSIVLVGEEPVAPYNRPPLSKELLRGDVPDELVAAEPPSFYERRAVELVTGVAVTALSPDDRMAELADGRRLRYGQALLATGATPRPLGVSGGERAMALRTLADATALRAAAQPGGRAAIVGGGFIGVEVAAALAARGVDVTLLERGAALWHGSFGTTVSEWAAAVLRSAGVTVRFGDPVVAVAAGGIRLPDESIPADLVLAGVGVEPRVELASSAGLRVDDGVVVGDGQHASAPGLFAAGDVARVDGSPRVEHWHAAREDGERAALAMLGEPLPPGRAPWIFSEFAGHKLDAFGETAGCDEMPVAAGVHAFTRGGRVAGMVILDGAIAPDAARSFVEVGPPVDQATAVLQGAASRRPVGDG